jgi:hypothetical protein
MRVRMTGPYDLAKMPGSDAFAYAFIPPKLFEKVTAEFESRLEADPRFKQAYVRARDIVDHSVSS